MRVVRLLFASWCGVCLICAQSAGEMVSACGRIASLKAKERLTILPNDFESGVCWGAFAILRQSIETLNAAQRQSSSGACLRDDLPRARLIAAFTDFVKARPERSQEDFYPVARDALKAAFPCPAGSNRQNR